MSTTETVAPTMQPPPPLEIQSNGEPKANLPNGHQTQPSVQHVNRSFGRKYHHIAAIHRVTRSSVLSSDSTASPSFMGFRNLLVLVVSKFGELGPRRNHPADRF